MTVHLSDFNDTYNWHTFIRRHANYYVNDAVSNVSVFLVPKFGDMCERNIKVKKQDK